MPSERRFRPIGAEYSTNEPNRIRIQLSHHEDEITGAEYDTETNELTIHYTDGTSETKIVPPPEKNSDKK